MPDTARLYALSSTYNSPWLSDESGPSLLIDDPLVAVRWYLVHEREEHLDIAGHVSADGGATWEPLPSRDLLADAERTLVTAAGDFDPQARRTATVLRDALAAEAADWLDDRLRYVQPDDPYPYPPDEPDPSAWRRGGQIWALALGTVPDEQVLQHLTDRFPTADTDGVEKLRSGARDMLDALAVADSPAKADPDRLLDALAHMYWMTFGFETGQLRPLVESAQRSILDSLVARHPATAAVSQAHPDPGHRANQAARAYLHRLSVIGPSGDQRLLDDAARSLTEALAAAAEVPAAQQPGPGPEASPGPEVGPGPQESAIPGYPRRLPDDLQAAARWRLKSPKAHRRAEQTMQYLVQASTAHALTRDAAVQAGTPRAPAVDDAVRTHTRLSQELDELTDRDALLMHADVLADAEDAADAALHRIPVTMGEAAEAQSPPRTAAEIVARHETFVAEVTAAENRIAEALAEQRALTREALHRIFPSAATHNGMHTLRRNLLENSGLGADDFSRAHERVQSQGRTWKDLDTSSRANVVAFGRPPVTHEDVEAAHEAFQWAHTAFDELRISRPRTQRALKALDRAATPDAPAEAGLARVAQIAEASRERSRRAAPATPPRTPAEPQPQQPHLEAQHRQSGVRPT